MTTRLIVPAAAALLLAGCCNCRMPSKCADPVIGNWSADLPYQGMKAGSLIFERDADGTPRAFVLWRWGSPEWCSEVKIDGSCFSFRHPYGTRWAGTVMGDRMIARIISCDRKTGEVTGAWQPFEGRRNPDMCGCRTDDAKLGAPIDILKDGIDGFRLMNPEAQNGWSFKDGVLSNRVKFDKDGRKIGGWSNIMTRREDFYDFNLEYDVRVPKGANSGMYLRGRFEIQTVDSYGKPTDWNNARHNMAAYYGRVAPSVAAEKPAGEWQHVNVTLYRRHLTVILNGVKIIDNAPVTGVTGGAIDSNLFAAGPLYIQGDHTDADYRNMILRPAF